jgi:hypothetical protein
MPLILSKPGSTTTVPTGDKARAVGYSLTPEGTKQLRSVGIRSDADV